MTDRNENLSWLLGDLSGELVEPPIIEMIGDINLQHAMWRYQINDEFVRHELPGSFAGLAMVANVAVANSKMSRIQ